MKMTNISNALKSRTLLKAAGIGFVLGIFWFVAIRVVLYDKVPTHYHANFALYINGEKEKFEESVFYEEISSCGESDGDPLRRVHLHDMKPDVVHVHDDSATWGNFFENLGFVLGDKILYARTNTYVDGENGELTFILNGERVRNIANKVIQNEDVLLISFGNDDSNTKTTEQYEQIEASAAEYNKTADPSACSGSDVPDDFSSKLKDVLGF